MVKLYYLDESELNPIDRLGLAYCRLNQWEWDEILGPKPDGFDALPYFGAAPGTRKKKYRNRHDCIQPAMRYLESVIAQAQFSRCWWLFVLGRSEEEWIQWYNLKEVMESAMKAEQANSRPTRLLPKVASTIRHLRLWRKEG